MPASHKDLTRTFICIDFPNEVIKEVARIQNLIHKSLSFSGKITELENLHLTLKFLGHIDDKKLSHVQKALSKIKFPTLNLKLAQAGTFNFKSKPKIVWLKITGNVFELHKKIDETLQKITASPDKKQLFPKEERFMSHLTIARIKYAKSPNDFKNYIANIKPKKIEFQIPEFKLKSSDLRP
jgi:RNA 2',3'-cyclic 3'-phosphodiesterase